MKIETHSTYSAWKQIASRYPHLISYLNRHGYYTLAVQPASLWTDGLYDYDDVIVRHDFSYDGPYYGFGHVPDQWALEYAFTNHWSRNPRPRLFHFSAVSTHFAWESPPRITEDVAELEEPQPSFLETRPDYVELALTVPQGRKRNYFVTVAYEWELLLEAFRHRVEPGFIALIFGDHQPPFITNGQGDHDVAVHVLTDIPALPGPLAAAGFTAGGEKTESPDIKVGRSQRTGTTCAVSPAHLSSSNNHRLNTLRRLLAAAEQAPQPERGLRRRPSTEARKYCSGRSQKNP